MSLERMREVNGETLQHFPALEATIAADAQFLEQLVANAPVGFAVLLGHEYRFGLINRAFASLAPRRPIIGCTYVEVFPDLATHLTLLEKVYTQGAAMTSVEAQLMIDHGYGPEERWWRFTFTPLYRRTGAVEAIECCAEETTWHETERLAVQEKDAFLSVASHELRTPLTVLKGLTQMAQRRLAAGRDIERASANLAMAGQQIARLEALINQLLDITRIQNSGLPRTIERCDLGDLVRAAALRAQAMTDRHTIQLIADETALPINADPYEIQQALDNLLWNAVKFSPNGGTIAITIAVEAGIVTMRVHDSGIGIPPEGRERLFERFYRGANAPTRHFSGMGIGLYLSRQIAERHGGRLRLETTSASGSVFALELPLASE